MTFTTLIPDFDADLTLIIGPKIGELRAANKDLNSISNYSKSATMVDSKDGSYFIYIEQSHLCPYIVAMALFEFIRGLRTDFDQTLEIGHWDKTLCWSFDWSYRQLEKIPPVRYDESVISEKLN